MHAPATVRGIQSRRNEQVKKLRQALVRGERTPEGLLAVDTFHLLEEALSSHLAVRQMFFTEAAETQLRQLLDRHSSKPRMYRVAAKVFESISATPSAQGVAALVQPRSWLPEQLFNPAPALLVVLAGVQDPGNAGTILRTAEAFGATGALLLQGTVHPENPKLLRASAGSAFRLPHLHGLPCGRVLELLRQHGVRLYAAVAGARQTLDEVDFRGPLALAIGAEGTGVPEPILAAAHPVSIPHTSRVESLNAAVSAGIFLYRLYRAAAARGTSDGLFEDLVEGRS